MIAFRVRDTVQRERAAGFTHSHNDEVNWDVFNNWRGDDTLLRSDNDTTVVNNDNTDQSSRIKLENEL